MGHREFHLNSKTRKLLIAHNVIQSGQTTAVGILNFLLGFGLFSGAFAVSFRECKYLDLLFCSLAKHVIPEN